MIENIEFLHTNSGPNICDNNQLSQLFHSFPNIYVFNWSISV